jgi:cell division protein FtsW (lipid II flippase)
LPFVSHGGTALVVSSLAIGLALGAARGAKRSDSSQSLSLAPSEATSA